MKPTSFVILLAAFSSEIFGLSSEFAAGRARYADCEFKKAAEHFELAVKTNPDDAEAWYWAGMSYQRLADIATPFGGRYDRKARECLTKAMKLAPGQTGYRQALFDALLGSGDGSRRALREAAGILATMSESDPDYGEMCRRFERETKVNSSANAHLGRLFLAAPRAAYQIAALPVTALSSRRLPASSLALLEP